MATEKKYVSLSKLSTFLDNLKTKFATITHTHKISDITDYKVDNALSSTSENPVQNKVLNEEFDAISDAMEILEKDIDSKVSTTTLSDYYTRTEVDNALAQKSQVQIIKWEADD